jgi:hypothetical protein
MVRLINDLGALYIEPINLKPAGSDGIMVKGE